MQIPQVNNGAQSGVVNFSHMPSLPSNTPWGNLTLKFVKIAQRTVFLNTKLGDVYGHFEEQKSAQGFSIDLCSLEIEVAVYLIRKTVDELIQLLYVAYCWQNNRKYPHRIQIDSIGTLLDKKKSLDFYLLFEGQYTKLEQLNDVANAYKHSFLNSDLTLTGRDEPVVFSLGVKYNNLAKTPEFNSIALRDFVIHFDGFYQFSKKKLVELFEKSDMSCEI